jgi:hypothetical protein
MWPLSLPDIEGGQMRKTISLYPDSPSALDNSFARVTSDEGVTHDLGLAVPTLTQVSSVVRELHGLLEDYAPAWYSERHHNLAEQAIEELERIISLRSAMPAA